MGRACSIAVLLPVLAGLCGCTMRPVAPAAVPAPAAPRTATAAGTYYSVDDCGEYTTLRPDGTFRVWQDEEAMEGRYVLRDKTILLTPADATMSLLGSLSGHELTDNKGRTWIRPPLSFADRDVDVHGYTERLQLLRAGWLVRP